MAQRSKPWDYLTPAIALELVAELVDNEKSDTPNTILSWVTSNTDKFAQEGWDYVEIESYIGHLPAKWQHFIQYYCEQSYMLNLRNFFDRLSMPKSTSND